MMSAFDYLVRDARPARVVSIGTWEPTPEPLLVIGERSDTRRVLEIAHKLAYGSLILLRGLSDEEASRFNEQVSEHFFREWSPYGIGEGRSWVRSVDDLGYGSHTAVLVGTILRTTGPVLEVGSGHSSTPILHEICAAQGRKLVTIETQVGWLRRFLDFESDLHHLTSERALQSKYIDENWSVVFVDHAPGEERPAVVEAVRDRAEYIVVHDTETLSYGLEPVLDTFRYRRDHRRHRPWTTVVSDKKEVW